MSITSALQTGVSGLQANSTAVGGISENIANANTVGYRRGFTHMVTTTASGGQGSGVLSVSAVEELDISTAGGLVSTTSNTDMAVSGNGFFVVSVNPNETVQTNYMLTRAGSFLPDENGDLVNAAGFYLAGFPYDTEGSIGSIDRSGFNQMETVNVNNIALSAAGTTEIAVLGNLPAEETDVTTAGDPYLTSSEYFTDLGSSERLSFSWQPTTTKNTWEITLSTDEGGDLGTVTVEFDDSGSLAGSPLAYSNATSSASAPEAFSFDETTGIMTVTLNVGTDPQSIDIPFGEPGTFEGISQFSGDFSQSFERNGSSVGSPVRVEIDEDGTLNGVFDNGLRRALYEIPVVTVANPNGLLEVRGNAYTISGDAGAMYAGEANSGQTGALTSGALEGSNVDIAEEMTDLIKVQRAFSSNAKVITTVDQMMEETTQLKR